MTQETYEFKGRRIDDTHIWIGTRIVRIVFEPAVSGIFAEKEGTPTWNRPAHAIVMTEGGSAYYFEGAEAEALKYHPMRGNRSE